MASEPPTELRACRLAHAAGEIAWCVGADCPFWEEGGAVVPPGCIFERVRLDAGDAGLVHALLDAKRQFECAASAADRAQARALVHRLLGETLELAAD